MLLKAGLAAAALVAIVAVSASTVVVTPFALGEWQASHSNCNGGASTGNQEFVLGPAVPPLGTGSLQFMTGTDGGSFETFRYGGLNGTRLADLTALSYSAYTTSSGGQVVYVNLRISSMGDGVMDNQLFFEPVYQTATFNPDLPDQGPIVPGTWQDWDALVGGWWDLNGFAGPGTGVRPLSDYIAAFPDAMIVNDADGLGGFRLAAGCGSEEWAAFVGHADNVTVATAADSTTFDFELVGPPSTTTTTATTTTSSTTTVTATTTGTVTTTAPPAIPFFSTTTAIVVALIGAIVGGVMILRRRRQ